MPGIIHGEDTIEHCILVKLARLMNFRITPNKIGRDYYGLLFCRRRWNIDEECAISVGTLSLIFLEFEALCRDFVSLIQVNCIAFLDCLRTTIIDQDVYVVFPLLRLCSWRLLHIKQR